MPVSSRSRNACATSTYSATTTRAGTSVRDDSSNATRAQHRAQQRLDALERPAAGERLVDQRVEPALIVQHAAHDAAEERGFGRKILRALDLAPDPVALELGQDVIQWRRRDIHLVECLHGGEPRCAAAVRLAVLARCRCPSPRFPHQPALQPHQRQAQRGAAALVLAGRARVRACASVSTVRMPLPIGMSRAVAMSIRPRADLPATMS